MSKIIVANQNEAFELINKRIKNGIKSKQLDDLIEIVKKHYPNYSKKDIESLFKSIKNNGCAYSVVANALASQIYTNDGSFEEMFGFSLYIENTDVIDYNKMLVDLYTSLYNVVKLNLSKYEYYTFDTTKQACMELLNENAIDDNEASIKLFNKGIHCDGFTNEGKLKFKNIYPAETTQVIGTYSNIAKEVLGIDVENITKEELIELLKEKNIEISSATKLEPADKVSGLTTKNLNEWINYYLEKHNLNLDFDAQYLPVSTYENFEQLINKINELVSLGFTIEVSVQVGKQIYIHNKKPFSWTPLGNGPVGHAMTFKGIDESGDIIVSTWGEDYIVPKEYYKDLELTDMKINPKIRIKNNDNLYSNVK